MKISELVIFTTKIQDQLLFYKEYLKLELVDKSANQITFKTGLYYLSFKKSEDSVQAHFAFTIPNKSIEDARAYLLKRNVELIESGTDFITDFPNWKAKSLYFYDADRNIVEFIERGDIPITQEKFHPNSIVSISEIAIPTNNIKSVHKKLDRLKPIEVYYGDFDRFCALGNPHGLFIVFDHRIKNWYPTDEKAYPADFIIKGDYNFHFKGGDFIPIEKR